LRLTAVGRRSGQPRSVILGYVEDGADYVTMAMNGWMEGDPAWWLNLQANPEATVVVRGGEPQRVRALAAVGEERDRLWARWREIDEDLDGWAAQRSTGAAVVVLQVLGSE
jgi:deazaflavin-dependent oxidoreductase (nitroreductase family)